MTQYVLKFSLLAIAISLVACSTQSNADRSEASRKSEVTVPREFSISVENAVLYAREIGSGPPVIVLHGGPDFDTSYLLPEMDRLSSAFRLIYYDQRGRGRSAARVSPDQVSMTSEMRDLDEVRKYFGLERATLLGHSWGAVLALEYAIRHPDRVTRLVLMNPAPASRADFLTLLRWRNATVGEDLERKKAIAATAGYREGDPDAVTAYYRVHFKAAFERAENLERILPRFQASFTKEGVLKARAIESRLMDETWLSDGYDLIPMLRTLNVPALVIWGEHDFIPRECSEHIAAGLANASLVVLKECGHFTYFECADATSNEIFKFARATSSPDD